MAKFYISFERSNLENVKSRVVQFFMRISNMYLFMGVVKMSKFGWSSFCKTCVVGSPWLLLSFLLQVSCSCSLWAIACGCSNSIFHKQHSGSLRFFVYKQLEGSGNL